MGDRRPVRDSAGKASEGASQRTSKGERGEMGGNNGEMGCGSQMAKRSD